MKNKYLVLLFLIVSLCCITLSGCNTQETNSVETTSAVISIGGDVTIASVQSINDIHLRDKSLLYANDDPYDVVTMYLTVQTGNPSDGTDHTWEEVNTYSAYYYEDLGIDRYKVAALLQIGDESGLVEGALGYGESVPNATVQIRGQTSSKYDQKNYKIRLFDSSGKWNGQKTICLNKHQEEGLRFRNKLAYDLLSEIPQIMSLRTQFVHLYVRDLTGENPDVFEDYGIYTQVEQLNKTALESHGLDKNGYLYKINNYEFYEDEAISLVTDSGYDESAFNYYLETKGSNNHEKLLSLIDAVNDFSLSSDDFLDTYMDRENLAYWMAFMILMGNEDTQNRNFYLYSPLNGDKWYVYPWDNDHMLFASESDIRNMISSADSWEIGISNYWGNLLFRKALQSDSFKDELTEAIEDLYNNYLSQNHIQELANKYADVLRSYLYQMPDINHEPLTSEQYDVILDTFSDEIDDHYMEFYNTLTSPMPFYIGTPEINENTVTLVWDPSYDMAGTDVTYHVILARDYDYQDVLFEQNSLRLTTASFNTSLEPGQYFLKVTATNKLGYSMPAFDFYQTPSYGKIYGTISFYVREDGSIDLYTNTEG